MTTTTSPNAAIRTGTVADQDALTRVLADAFLHGDLGPHLIPQLSERARVYWPYFQILGGYALTSSAAHVDIIGGLDTEAVAAAIWYEVGDQLGDDPPDYAERLADAVAGSLPRFLDLDAAMHDHHPTGRPHHYLGHLAVLPAHQGQGFGGLLLEHHHRQLDAAGIPGYLEATGPRNHRLYARHHYQKREPYPVGPGAPLVFPMWREPRRRRRRTQTGQGHTARRSL